MIVRALVRQEDYPSALRFCPDDVVTSNEFGGIVPPEPVHHRTRGRGDHRHAAAPFLPTVKGGGDPRVRLPYRFAIELPLRAPPLPGAVCEQLVSVIPGSPRHAADAPDQPAPAPHRQRSRAYSADLLHHVRAEDDARHPPPVEFWGGAHLGHDNSGIGVDGVVKLLEYRTDSPEDEARVRLPTVFVLVTEQILVANPSDEGFLSDPFPEFHHEGAVAAGFPRDRGVETNETGISDQVHSLFEDEYADDLCGKECCTVPPR